MELSAVISEIKTYMQAESHPEMVDRYARYFREGYDAYGLSTDDLHELQRRLLNKYNTRLGWQGFLDLGDLLMKEGKYEEIMLAILLASACKKQAGPVAVQRWGAWLDQGVTTWAHTDVMCAELLGYLWQQNLITLDDMAAWRQAESKWKRRAVPVSLLVPLKKGHEIQSLLDFIDPMMTDDQRVVQQGLGWFLREAWKSNQEPLESFLMKWREKAPRLIYQYATEKMTRESRERFRRPRKNSRQD